MTFEFIDTTHNDTLMVICTEPAQPVPSLKLRVQPWLKSAIACICVTQGLRFLNAHDPVGTLAGLALMLPVPSCLYLGWRDYQGLKNALASRAGGRTRELRRIVR
ncbi:MAG TPA: hypothetical protein VME43_11805 [Bryobacteraceae bacterium]|nr:hypothetical protein [Bryobacteraceae bacterium]